jgi:TusA-related sulfurtransferase
MKYKSPIAYHSKDMAKPKLKFLKSGSNFKVKVTRSKIIVPIESSCHKEHTYEILITYHSKYMANVKVFEKWVKLQGQGHKVKNFGTYRKVSS